MPTKVLKYMHYIVPEMRPIQDTLSLRELPSAWQFNCLKYFLDTISANISASRGGITYGSPISRSEHHSNYSFEVDSSSNGLHTHFYKSTTLISNEIWHPRTWRWKNSHRNFCKKIVASVNVKVYTNYNYTYYKVAKLILLALFIDLFSLTSLVAAIYYFQFQIFTTCITHVNFDLCRDMKKPIGDMARAGK